MVSNTLEMEVADLARALRRIKRTHARDAEYRKVRADLPAKWPI